MELRYISKVSNFRIAFGITMLAFLLLDSGANALSNDGGGSWKYSKDITIRNDGGDLMDYQVLLNLDISNFPTNAQPNGADIRFADANEKELSYWIEKWYYSGKNANIWVKVPRIPANGEIKIKMYYGNPSAGAVSNGDTTFEFFDDFNSLSWQKFGNASEVSTLEGKSVVTITGWGEIVSPISLQSPNYAFDSMSKLTSGMEAYMPFFGFGQSDRTGDEDNDYQFGYNVYHPNFLDNIRIIQNKAWVANQNGGDAYTRRTEWAKTSFMVFAGTLTQKVDDSSKGMQQITLTDTAYWAGMIPKEIGIIVWNGATYAVDWVLIRKYTSPEPIIASIGDEQTIPGSISVISSPSGAEVLVDGVSKGTAAPTLTVSGIAPGSHTVKCRLSGYSDDDVNIIVTPGYVATTTCTLTPIPTPTPTPTATPTATPSPTPIETQTRIATITATTPAPTTPVPTTPVPVPTTPIPPPPPEWNWVGILMVVLVIAVPVAISLFRRKTGKSKEEQKPVKQELLKCPKCGGKVSEEDVFCGTCGKRLRP